MRNVSRLDNASRAPRLRNSDWVRSLASLSVFLLILAFAACAHSQHLPGEIPDAPQPQIQKSIQQSSQTQSQSQSQSLPASDPLQPVPDGGAIRGVVVDHEGSVYQGVHITLTRSVDPESPSSIATTDTNGRFQFSTLPPGPFRLTISSEGFATRQISGELHPGEIYEPPAIELSFATATSEVRVTASQVEVAQEQLHEEEQQRIFGVIPNFYVVYEPNAPPLDKRQKFDLAWKSSIDPVTIGFTGVFAGIEQATNQFSGYGQGAQGYAKRFGANYADNFISTMLGSAILPALLKQDPRYFYKGTGTVRSRILYAIANSVVCKGDNGHWQTNYSGILGGLAAGGISNLYYPASDREGATLTFEETLIGIAGSAAQNLFQEFLVRRLTPRLPSYAASKP
jgi:hypothetical protein